MSNAFSLRCIYLSCKVLYFILSDDDFEIKSKIYSFNLRLVLKHILHSQDVFFRNLLFTIPQNGYDVSAFFDAECRQGERETSEDEGEEETLRELLFFDFECRQENGTHEPNLCIVQNEAGDEWVF